MITNASCIVAQKIKESKTLKSLLKPFNVFLAIVAIFFCVYYVGLISEKLKNTRIFFNDSENAIYTDISSKKNISLQVHTNNLTQMHLFFQSNAENLDYSISLDNVKKADYITFLQDEKYNNDYVLVIKFPNGIQNKKELTLNIQSSNMLLKETEEGKPFYKQYGLTKAKMNLILFGFSFIFFAFFVLLLITRNLKQENKYLLFATVLGLAFLFIRPPCSQYDDLIHYDTAYNMSNIMLGLGDSNVTNNLPKRACDLNLLPNYYPNNYYEQYHAWHGNYKDYYHHVAKNFSFSPDTTIVASLAEKPMKNQRAFIFSALAITFGRIIGLNQFLLYYLGAFTNLVLCILLIYVGLRKNKIYNRHIIFCLSLFPVVIMLFASYSYDALLISFSYTVINYSIAIFYQKNKSLKDIIVLTILCIFMIPIKAVYFPICFFIIFLVYFENSEKNFKRIGILLLCILSVYAISCILALTHSISFLESHGINSLTRSDSITYNISTVLLKPINAINYIIRSFISEAYTLSFMDLFFYVPKTEKPLEFIKYIYLLLFLMLLFSTKDDFKIIPGTSLIILGFVSAFIYLVTFQWTPMNYTTLWGIQARYFTPVLPFLFYSTSLVPHKNISITPENCSNLTISLSFLYAVDMLFRIIF